MTTMRKSFYLLFFLIQGILLLTGSGMAANFSVDPVNIYFDPGQKTGLLTITNYSDENLTLQLTAFLWKQDEDGKDKYVPTDDIILFPKILTIGKSEKRLIRIGIQIPPGQVEKTYRIYLEEIPRPEQSESGGAVLRTVMKVGVPVFLSPIKKRTEGAIDRIDLSKGNLSISVHNTGNCHFIIKKVTV